MNPDPEQPVYFLIFPYLIHCIYLSSSNHALCIHHYISPLSSSLIDISMTVVEILRYQVTYGLVVI